MFSNRVPLEHTTNDLTNLQREEANKEIKAYKNQELSKAYKQQYTVMNNAYMDRQIEIAGLSDTLKKTQIERDRLPEGSKDRVALDKKIDELNADIALQMEMQTASMQAMQEIANKERVSKMLSNMKTLLEETRVTAKQALEDGLVTFLTDGVKEAKSLGEALQNLVIDFLKTMQQFFAKRLVYGLMQKWFPAKDEYGQRMTTENLGEKVRVGQEYTLNQYRDKMDNGLIDYSTPSKSQIYIMKSEDGTGINGIQTYRDNSDILGLRNPETGNYFEMNSKPNNYNLMNTWMQDGQGGYFRVLDQDRTYSELENSQSALASPVLQSETGVLGQKLDMISSTLQNNAGNGVQSSINAQPSEAAQQISTSMQSASTEIIKGATSISTGFEQVADSARSAANALNQVTSPVGHKYGGLIKKFSAGGNVTGKGTSTSDSIPAMLSNGEFVVKASAVREYGAGFLNAVNNGNFSKLHMPIARFADGGSVLKEASDSTEITNGTTKISTGFEQVAESAQSAAMALRLINASIG